MRLGMAVITAALALLGGAPGAKADFVKDVLVGNTVTTTNVATGESVVYKLKADGTLTRQAGSEAPEFGVWFDTASEICAAFATVNEGERQCTPKPKEAITVPGERLVTFPGKNGAPPLTVRITYSKGH